MVEGERSERDDRSEVCRGTDDLGDEGEWCGSVGLVASKRRPGALGLRGANGSAETTDKFLIAQQRIRDMARPETHCRLFYNYMYMYMPSFARATVLHAKS